MPLAWIANVANDVLNVLSTLLPSFWRILSF
jgi:hypothetical protein